MIASMYFSMSDHAYVKLSFELTPELAAQLFLSDETVWHSLPSSLSSATAKEHEMPRPVTGQMHVVSYTPSYAMSKHGAPMQLAQKALEHVIVADCPPSPVPGW